ncbi:MAG: M13 family metallopeptidase [Clostridia bacterium]|nr:M13 family metallopeptidase [Clostridia bacterium]
MENVRIQDDLYLFVNQKKLDELVIPDDMPRIGGFASLDSDVEKLMMGEFNEMCENESYPNDYLKRACALYKAAKNAEKKEADGIAPALKRLSAIEALDSIKTFNKELASLVLNRAPLPFHISVGADMKDTEHNCVGIQGPSVILPDASFYKPDKAQQKVALIGMWSNMAKLVLAKTDLTEDEQAKYIEDTLAFDELLAGLVKSREEWSEYVKAYNPMKVGRVATMMKPVELKSLLKSLFGFVPETIIVEEPRYFKGFKEVFNEETFGLYKHWAYVTGLLECCSYLGEELREIGGMFYRAISGIPAVTPIEKFSYQLASGMYSEPVGLYYGEKYFGEAAKKDITEIVYQIIDTYKKRIKDNDFLEDATKEKAILKLSKMGVKMGYPDKVDELYDKLVFDEGASLFDIVVTLQKIRFAEQLASLTKPVNKEEWAMPGHMVNACYNPFVNDITFPAAILQAPFYSIKQSRSENLGGIGAVIGHEISHAFDSNGAQCDENGNINNWWTKEDNRKFKKKINAMVKQFDGIELPWGKVNGKFIVSENMADNGGMAVTLDIMSRTEGASYEEYFMNWARVWCVKAKPEFQQLLLTIDVHGPAVLRANIPPRNFAEWYDTFGVKKTDKMYIAPSKRVVIW